jgi:hypothetical protein
VLAVEIASYYWETGFSLLWLTSKVRFNALLLLSA